MMMAARVSMTMPTRNRNRFMSSRMTYLLLDRASISLARTTVSCSMVRILPKAVAVLTRISTVPETRAVLAKILYRSLNLISLYTKIPMKIA